MYLTEHPMAHPLLSHFDQTIYPLYKQNFTRKEDRLPPILKREITNNTDIKLNESENNCLHRNYNGNSNSTMHPLNLYHRKCEQNFSVIPHIKLSQSTSLSYSSQSQNKVIKTFVENNSLSSITEVKPERIVHSELNIKTSNKIVNKTKIKHDIETILSNKPSTMTNEYHLKGNVANNFNKVNLSNKVYSQNNIIPVQNESMNQLNQETQKETHKRLSPIGLEGLMNLAKVANEQLGKEIAKERKRNKSNNSLHLWEFLLKLLETEEPLPLNEKSIQWTNKNIGEFRLLKTSVIANLWGKSKNRNTMTYEKMARAMRYYYKMKVLVKVPHKRLHFQFGPKLNLNFQRGDNFNQNFDHIKKNLYSGIYNNEIDYFMDNRQKNNDDVFYPINTNSNASKSNLFRPYIDCDTKFPNNRVIFHENHSRSISSSLTEPTDIESESECSNISGSDDTSENLEMDDEEQSFNR